MKLAAWKHYVYRLPRILADFPLASGDVDRLKTIKKQLRNQLIPNKLAAWKHL